MKKFLLHFLSCVLLWTTSYSLSVEETLRRLSLGRSNLDVTLPIPGGVYQRNSFNQGNITVAGTFNSQRWINGGFYKLILKLTPLDLYGIVDVAKQSYQTELTVALDNKGSFYHKFTNINAGWYELRIAPLAISENREHSSMRFNVGVGEVFIIAGQSNAQGLPNNSDFNYPNEVHVAAPDPVLDAVRVQPNKFNESQFLGAENPNSPLYTNEYYRIASFNLPIKRPVLSYLKSGRDAKDNPNSGISPLGNSLWFWASLGEKLAERYKVPIAFFNAAWGGTTITQWAESTDPNAQPLGRPDGGQGNPARYQPGAPYGILKNTLKFYASIYGVRAVLWQQGETDTEALVSNWEGRKVANQADYRDKLLRIIDQSRKDLSKDISWVIARTSKHHTFTSDLVKNAQNAAIQSINALYYGPETDNIDISRRSFVNDLTHFSRAGLANLAQAWFNSIEQSGILNPGGSIPVTPSSLNTEPQTVQFNANGTTSAPGGGSQYMWVYDNGTADLNSPICYDQSIPTNCTGTRRAIIQNSQGNYILTQAVSFPYTVVNDTNDGSTGSAPLSNGCYTVKAKHSNKFLQVADGNSGTRIRQQDGNGSTNQIFKLEVVDGNLYRISSQFSNKVLDAANAGSTAGTTINQYDWNNSAQQKWRLEANGDGTYKIVPSYTTSLAADVEGGNSDNGAGLFLWTHHGNDNQRFYVQASGCTGGATPPTGGNGNPSGGNYEGYFDGADCGNTWGWVYDRNNPNTSLTLELLVNGAVNATFTAAEYRQDLVNAGKGNGQHGFNFSPPANLKNGQPQTISLRVQGSSFLLTGSPKTITCVGNGSGPTTPTTPGGGNTCTTFAETCSGNNSEIRNITVSVGTEGDYPMTIQYRAPEKTVNGVVRINGAARSVTFSQIGSFQSQSIGTVHLMAGNNTIGLSSGADGGIVCFNSICLTGGTTTPTTPTNPTNPTNPSGSYEGTLDGAGCGNIWGWVYTSASPNTPVTVELLANGNVVSSFVASEFRQDLQNAGKGNGQHGFNYPPPSSIKNGQNQSISIRVLGNGFVLTGSPKNITCSGGRLSAGDVNSSEPSEDQLTVFPNPSHGEITARFFASKDQPIQLRIVDLTGRKLTERNVIGEGGWHKEVISLKESSNGLYLLQIQRNGKTITEKVILQK